MSRCSGYEGVEKLKAVLGYLQRGVAIPQEYKPHKLLGDYKDCMECHIENDTLLIWFDENTFHDDLWENVNVYLDCCVAAVAFFEKKPFKSFNPNVALEVGYMLGRGKKVFIIKDKRIKDLPTDLKGKICYDYDGCGNNNSLEVKLDEWMQANL